MSSNIEIHIQKIANIQIALTNQRFNQLLQTQTNQINQTHNNQRMQERITKLLILAGDQAAQHQKRDFDKIVTIIVDQYLSKNQPSIQQTIVTKLTTVIRKIPLKQHIYAGITAKISLQHKDLSNLIIQTCINNLEQALGEFEFYEAVNVLVYLSELMNIMLLNSLTFMNMLEDVLDMVESVSGNNHNAKRFYVGVLVRTLPVCLWSLSEKLFADLKKFMEMLEPHVQNDPLFTYLKGLVNKGNITNFSLMGRLEDKFQDIPQFNFKRKLKIECSLQKSTLWTPVQYFPLPSPLSDQLYRQFCQQQGRLHQSTIQHLIETFHSRGTILNMKMTNYINSIPSHKELYLYQLTISTLISKCLKSPRPIVEQSLLLSIVNEFVEKMGEEESGNLTKGELSSMLEGQVFEVFAKGESLDFSMILNVANLVSFLANNLKRDWDWERYLENEPSFVKRRVLLSLILEKVKVLNENFILPESFSAYPHYQMPQKLTNDMQYTTTEEMQVFQGFEQALKTKTPAQRVKQMITSEHQYQVFLQALFRRTALSHTHLKTLIERYRQVLESNKEYDWALINKIRNFWKKSYLNRQLYLQMMIKSEFTTFNSYVNYIGQLKDKNEREMVWVKIELNQLNNLFGQVGKKVVGGK